MSPTNIAAATPATRGLAALFATSGVVHLVRPEVFEPIVPDFVPRHREVVLISGIAELACAAGLMHPRTRRVAGLASTALLFAVYPANLKMAGDARKSDNTALQAASLGRLPLQYPLIRTAWRAFRGHG